jgi:regulator of protease activity HflC (stomatin/prohibitin superfamily)
MQFIGPILGLFVFGGFVLLVLVLMMVRVMTEYERGVVFRLGRVKDRAKGPGLIILLPFGIDRMVRVSLREIPMSIPSQDIITADNVTLKVNAVALFRVVDPLKSVIQVENYLYAVSQIAQTTLRATLGTHKFDDLLSERDKINKHLQEIIDSQTAPWGVKVRQVEIKDVDLPIEMQRAMAKQAEAEREKRAKIIHAEGEVLAAVKLKEASDLISQSPAALQLRYLQTLTEIATEKNSTTIFPIPLDLIAPFLQNKLGSAGSK